ncbi:DUF1836 domain-containing protein [Anaerocolumna xylanovorans]|uniref:DUF1836 domain-containing protein n=1 Tax=Anaerocolumna xylanovorans DSM 12503 TaxID=1121345 RepID=A0A1M7XZ09_9FIRM|nr:DUF1836 domain-containing protein [Anaerocolumna xylanovorans]SHO44346.1 protein of unknown function [Anaerocolumna xylanovorans DSM 12503]
MFTREDIRNYHCPRWKEWPGIELYMDQVISLIEESVSLFYEDLPAKSVTSTMINNYVKQKIIVPSKNKKYHREHLAYLYVLFLLKPVLSLTDIGNGISFMQNNQTNEESYDLFCDELEAALAMAFDEKEQPTRRKPQDIIQTIALAFAYTLLARYYIFSEKETSTAEETK